MDKSQRMLFKREKNDHFDLLLYSDIGDREEQQDRIGWSLDEKAAMVAICDGMGGHAGGSIASGLAVNCIVSSYQRHKHNINAAWLLNCLKLADTDIASQTRENGKPLNAGSTAVVVWISDELLYWGSVGDSRAYLLRGCEFVQLTKDQTYQIVLDEKKAAGLLTDEQYSIEAQRGETLISYLGIGNLNLIDYSVSPVRLRSGDRIIVMSDGLYKTVTDEKIQRILLNFKSGQEAAAALEELSKKCAKKANESRDNTTVAIISII